MSARLGRGFTQTVLSFLVLLSLSACVHKPINWDGVQSSLEKGEITAELSGAFPIIQGPTSENESHLRVLRPLEQNLKYFVKSDAQVIEVLPQSENLKETTGQEDWSMDHLHLLLEKPGVKNTLYVFDSKGRLKDQREFGFLNSAKEDLRLFVASCMADKYPALQKEMWNEAQATNSDIMLFIGDNVYADSGPKGRLDVNPKVLGQRYFETRTQLDIFRKSRLTPIFSIWDDHDFGMNNGGSNFIFKSEVSALFRTYFPVNGIGNFYENGPGLSSKIKFKNADVYLLDNRSFRSGPDVPGATGTHFGKDQEDWLFKSLDPKKLTFLVSGDQWFGGYHKFESYEGNHGESFKKFLKRLKSAKARVVFVSGDRHLTEIIKVPSRHLGAETYEITSSGIHASMYPGAFQKAPSPNQLIGVDGKLNFALIEFDNSKPVTRLRVQSLGQNSETLFEKTLKLP